MKQQNNQWKALLWPYFFYALFFSVLLIGCGPEPDTSNSEALTLETERIAQNYTANNDINGARTSLSSLSVANPNQWLVYVAETSISQNPNAAMTDSLVRLSLDLGLTSAAIEQRAIQIGILVPTPAVVAQAATTPIIQSTPAAPAPPTAAQVPSENPPEAPPEEALPTEAPADPIVSATDGLNVRSGPSTAFQIVGALEAGETAAAIGKNPTGDWWQILLASGQQGWVLGQLVTTSGIFDNITIAANIPEPPPPPPTAVPVPPTDTPAPVVEEVVPPPRSGTDFVMVERRLWSADENGGRMDGPSVVCGEKRELHVRVIDAAGNLLNGVAVQAQFGAKEIYVTGAQGKGEGKSEFVLGDGQDVKVVKDVDGRDVSSDLASGLVTIPYQIGFGDLIAAGYCTDDASCQKNVVDPYACGGHYSWSVTFQRTY